MVYGFVTKKSKKSGEDEMMLRMQEHHKTVCEFLYSVKTLTAQQRKILTLYQGFSLKMGRGWRAIQ